MSTFQDACFKGSQAWWYLHTWWAYLTCAYDLLPLTVKHADNQQVGEPEVTVNGAPLWVRLACGDQFRGVFTEHYRMHNTFWEDPSPLNGRNKACLSIILRTGSPIHKRDFMDVDAADDGVNRPSQHSHPYRASLQRGSQHAWETSLHRLLFKDTHWGDRTPNLSQSPLLFCSHGDNGPPKKSSVFSEQQEWPPKRLGTLGDPGQPGAEQQDAVALRAQARELPPMGVYVAGFLRAKLRRERLSVLNDSRRKQTPSLPLSLLSPGPHGK